MNASKTISMIFDLHLILSFRNDAFDVVKLSMSNYFRKQSVLFDPRACMLVNWHEFKCAFEGIEFVLRQKTRT